LTLGVILYYTIISYTLLYLIHYYILYYTLLFCSPLLYLLFFCSIFFIPPLPLPNIHSILVGSYIYLFILFSFILFFLSHLSQSPLIYHLFHLPILFPIFILYLSVLTYTYLYSRLIFSNLTPHVLSEWMVEVCGKYLYRYRLVFVF